MLRNSLRFPSGSFRVGVACCCFLLIAGTAAAQEATTAQTQESEYESLAKAEADADQAFSGPRKSTDLAIRAHRRLKSLLEAKPDSIYRFQILEDMRPLQQLLGEHDLAIAVFYMETVYPATGRWKAAEARLLRIVNEYPTFSKMDEVLLRLGDLAARDEKAEDASRYLWTVVCNYPESKLSETVFGKLNQVGSSFAGCSKTTVQSTR